MGTVTGCKNHLKGFPGLKDRLVSAAKKSAEDDSIPYDAKVHMSNAVEEAIGALRKERHSLHSQLLKASPVKAINKEQANKKAQRDVEEALKSEESPFDIEGESLYSVREDITQPSTAKRIFNAVNDLLGVPKNEVGTWNKSTLQIWEKVSDVPQAQRHLFEGNTQGVAWIGDRAIIVAERVQAGTERGVILHEVGTHVGLETYIGKDGVKRFASQIERLGREGTEVERAAVAAARARIPKDTPKEHVEQELIGYTAEELSKRGILPNSEGSGGVLMKRLQQIVAGMLRKVGLFKLADKALSGQDIVNVLQGSTKRALYDIKEPTRPPVKGELRSVAESDVWREGKRLFAPERGNEIDRMKSLVTADNVKQFKLNAYAKIFDRWGHSKTLLETAFRSGSISKAQRTQSMINMAMVDALPSLTKAAINDGMIHLTTLSDGVKIWASKNDGASPAGIMHALQGQDKNQYDAYSVAIHGMAVGFDKVGIPLSEQANARKVAQQIIAEGNAIPAFVKAHELQAKMNHNIVDALVSGGRISAEEASKWKPDTYTPLYSTLVNGDVMLNGGTGKLVRMGNVRDMPELKHLLGGEKQLLPFEERMARNIEVMSRAAVTNYTTKSIAFALKDLGMGSIGAPRKGDNANAVHFFVKGEAKTFRIDRESGIENAERAMRSGSAKTREQGAKALKLLDDTNYISIPDLVSNMAGTAMLQPAALRIASAPARMLHTLITRNPLYPIRQLPRDIAAAYALHGMDNKVAADVFSRVKNVWADSDKTATMLRSTGMADSNVLKGGFGDEQRQLSKMFSSEYGGGHGVKGMLSTMSYLADKWAHTGDLSIRAMMYESGIKKGMSESEAWLYALEGGTNFKTRGSSSSLYMANMLTPFMNSQLRSLDTTFRALRGMGEGQEKSKAFEHMLTRATLMGLSTLAYHAMLSDEPWYQELSPEVRAANYFIKFPGMDEPMMFPIPFEVGTLFKAIPEMMATLFKDSNGLGMHDAWKMLKAQIVANMPGGAMPVGENVVLPTLGLPGVAVKTVMSTLFNTDTFSGAPIESNAMQQVARSERYDAKTSDFAKQLGEATDVSPKKIDYMLRGFGSNFLVAIAHAATAAVTTKDPQREAPTERNVDNKFISGFFAPLDAHATVNAMYESVVNPVKQAHDTLRHKKDVELDEEGAEKYAAAHEVELSAYSTVGDFTRRMSQLNRAKRQITNEPGVSGAAKRAELDKLAQEVRETGLQMAEFNKQYQQAIAEQRARLASR